MTAKATSGALCASIFFLILIHNVSAHDDPFEDKSIENSAPPGTGGGGPYPSVNMNLLGHLSLADIGGGIGILGSDIWGWTDTLTGKDYALFGRTDGTAFVDISDPTNPTYLGDLLSHTGNSVWRDIKVYNDNAFIVSDGNGAHGMQIFDLTDLRGVTTPAVFAETAHYDGFTKAHNIAINEQSGFAYAVGTNTASGGLHIVDINDPLNPMAAGTFSADGYTHDSQVVNYQGTDTDYAGREIAFNSNEDTLTIVDVTDKSSTDLISSNGYANSRYSHQGWLSEDHRYFFMNDELDERNLNQNTRTHVWDVQDLDNPVYVGFHESDLGTIDHNLYVHDGLIYQANYTSGLRVLEVADVGNALFTEIASFDTYPDNDATTFNGAWSVFPFFDSGSIIVSDRQNGLFVLSLQEQDGAIPEPATLPLLALGVTLSVWARIRR